MNNGALPSTILADMENQHEINKNQSIEDFKISFTIQFILTTS